MVVGEFSTETDVVVVGGGDAARTAATQLAATGRSVTLVDDTISADAERFEHDAPRRLAARAINGVTDLATVRTHLHDARERADDADRAALDAAGVIRLVGVPTFDGPRQLSIGECPAVPRLRFKRAIVASPGPVAPPEGANPYGDDVWTLATALDVPALPKQVIVRGGSAAALDVARLYRRLGSAVHLDVGPTFLADVPDELVQTLRAALEAAGITLGHDLPSAGTTVLAGDHRDIEALGVARTGAQLDGARLRLDAHLRTTEPRVYAVGPAAGLPDGPLSGAIAAAAMNGDDDSVWDVTTAPVILPGLIWIGDAPADAQRFESTTAGVHALLVVERDSGLIFGAGAAGPHAERTVALLVLALEMGAVAGDVAALALPGGDPAGAIVAAARLADTESN